MLCGFEYSVSAAENNQNYELEMKRLSAGDSDQEKRLKKEHKSKKRSKKEKKKSKKLKRAKENGILSQESVIKS